jgi:hypothetical protein
MKILSITLIVIIVVAAAFLGVLYYYVRGARQLVSPFQSGSTATSAAAGHLQTINPPTTTPVNFQGPPAGSFPHVIGPSGPPPNY